MELNSFDLNLLYVLDAVLTERNVAQAAGRLGISRTTASDRLRRLREFCDDPLLVQHGHEQVLTAAAEKLHPHVREFLNAVHDTFRHCLLFDPDTTQRTFTIAASDYTNLVLLHPLIRALRCEAPGISIHAHKKTGTATELLHDNASHPDLVIEPRDVVGETELPTHGLFSDRWLCAVATDNQHVSSSRRIMLEEFHRLPRLEYTIAGAPGLYSLIDRHLERLGVHVWKEMAVDSFTTVPFLLQGTDLVSVVLERAMQRMRAMCPEASEHVRLLEPPVQLPRVDVAMYWHPRHTEDAGHQWLRARLTATAADFD